MTDLAATALILVAFAAAAAYGGRWLRGAPSALRSLLKTLPLAAATALTVLWAGPWLLVAALALSAVGDLALSRDGERAFLVGLGAFLAAHLAYIVLFVGMVPGPPANTLIAGGAVVALVVYGYFFLAILWDRLGDMRWPVAAYVVAIVAMGAAAILTGQGLLIAGALLFAASDSILALELFLFRDRPRRWTAPSVWASYCAAQAAIVAAVLT